jgi:hypothetical protein
LDSATPWNKHQRQLDCAAAHSVLDYLLSRLRLLGLTLSENFFPSSSRNADSHSSNCCYLIKTAQTSKTTESCPLSKNHWPGYWDREPCQAEEAERARGTPAVLGLQRGSIGRPVASLRSCLGKIHEHRLKFMFLWSKAHFSPVAVFKAHK